MFLNKIKTVLISASFFGVVLVIAPTHAAIDLNAPVPNSPKVVKGTLPNGLTYYIRKNNYPEKKLELRLVVKAGSVLEDDDQLGLAHFAEHMAFNGTKHFKKNEMVSFLESIGVKFGADLNASTGFNVTNYMLPIPTDKIENVEKGFLILSDWAQGITFDNEEIDKERGVVLEEARSGKGAGQRIFRKMMPEVFHNSRYEKRLPIGDEHLLKTFKHDSLKRFYRDWYRPNLMAVIVVGDIDPEMAQKLIEKNFSHLKNPESIRLRENYEVPLTNKDKILVLTDKELTTTSITMMQTRFKDVPELSFREYRNSIKRSLFNRLMNDRIAELTQVQNPPFVAAGTSVSSLIEGYSQLNSHVTVGRQGIDVALKALISENLRVAKYGFTANELARTKKNRSTSMDNLYKEREKIRSSEFVGEYTKNFLQDEPYPEIEQEYGFYKDILESIGIEELNLYAKEILSDTAPKLVMFQGPEKADIATPTADVLSSSLKIAQSQSVTPYEDKQVSSQILEQIPTAGKIVSETEDKKLGTLTWILSNGLKVTVMPTQHKADQILFRATRLGGFSQVTDQEFGSAKWMLPMINAMGYKDWTPMDLSKMLAGRTLGVNTSMSDVVEGFSGSANQIDFENLLQLFRVIALSPRKDVSLFESSRTRMQDVLKNQMRTPTFHLQKAFNEHAFIDHPRRPKAPQSEDFANLNVDQLIELYRSRFSSFKGMHFVFVGNIERQKAKNLVETYIASLPVDDLNIGWKDHKLSLKKGEINKNVFAGQEDKSILLMVSHSSLPMSMDEARRLSAWGEILQIRVTNKIREEMGAGYSPRIGVSTQTFPTSEFKLSFSLSCDPKNSDNIAQTIKQMIRESFASAPTQAELDKVKENWLINFREAIKTNDYWVSYLNATEIEKKHPHRSFDYEKEVEKISTEQILESVRKFVNLENLIQITLYPEKLRETIENQQVKK